MLHYLRSRGRGWAWIVLLAVFGLAGAPTLSRALAQVRGGGAWMELCSAASGDAAGQPAAVQPGDACSLCVLGAAPSLPPAVVAGPPVPTRAAGAVPALPSAGRPVGVAWAARASRAPPRVA